MKSISISSVSLAFAGLLVGNTVFAFEVTTEFSADAVQRAPDRAEYRARMYVSKNAVRTDSVINKIAVTEIMKSRKQVRLLLVAKDKIYFQQKSTQVEKINSDKPAAKKPCTGLKDTTCEMLGKEKINNRQTEKWQFVVKRNGQTYRSLHWIDVKRKMPVREFFPDGTVTELSINGKEKMNGRETEKWLLQTTRPDGQQLSSKQWYDPELGLTIREEVPGGFIRELQNIKTGRQDKKLFAIPAGYKKVEQLPAYLSPPQPAVRPGSP